MYLSNRRIGFRSISKAVEVLPKPTGEAIYMLQFGQCHALSQLYAARLWKQ
jgi:hypothetical protein